MAAIWSVDVDISSPSMAIRTANTEQADTFVLGLGAGLGCVLASRVMHALGHAGKDHAGLDTAQSGISIKQPKLARRVAALRKHNNLIHLRGFAGFMAQVKRGCRSIRQGEPDSSRGGPVVLVLGRRGKFYVAGKSLQTQPRKYVLRLS